MTPKERTLAILNRQPVDRIPVDLWHTPEISAALRQHFAVADDFAMWRALGLDKIVWDFMDYKTDAGERAGGQSGAGAESGGDRTMWGVPLKNIQAGEANYAEFGTAPLTGYDTPSSLDNYPWWPKVDRFELFDTYEIVLGFIGENFNRFAASQLDALRVGGPVRGRENYFISWINDGCKCLIHRLLATIGYEHLICGDYIFGIAERLCDDCIAKLWKTWCWCVSMVRWFARSINRGLHYVIRCRKIWFACSKADYWSPSSLECFRLGIDGQSGRLSNRGDSGRYTGFGLVRL